MDDISKTIATFFKEEWSREDVLIEGVAMFYHEDGEFVWDVTFDFKRNYLWISCRLKTGRKILESNGKYDAAKIHEVSGGFQALTLHPIGVTDNSSFTWLCRCGNGPISHESYVGMVPEPSSAEHAE